MPLYKNILIVRTDRIGDVILTTPVIKALRKAYPKSKISMLVAPLTKPLVEANPYLDEVIVDDRQARHKGIVGFWRLVAELRQKHYDLAVVLHTKKRTNALCFFAGIPQRVGYKNNKFGFLLTHPIKDTRHHGHQHEVQYCLDVLKPLGIVARDWDIFISIRKTAQNWMKDFRRKHGINKEDKLIVIHPGASDPAKCWSTKHFAALIDQLNVRWPQSKFILVGTISVRAAAKEIQRMSRSSVIDLTGQTTVPQLLGVLRQADLLISNDSGPVHMAAALSIPVISIFTRNQPGINPRRWHPLGKASKFIVVTPETTAEDILPLIDERNFSGGSFL